MLIQLRDNRTAPSEFTRLTRELTRLLIHAALSTSSTESIYVPGHTGERIPGARISDRVAALAILRAGLGMVEPVRDLFPEAPIYQIGIRRDEITLRAQAYTTYLPRVGASVDHLLVLDPMLATGGSASAAVAALRRSYDGSLSYLGLIGAPLGVQRLLEADADIVLCLAALDDRLDERGYIIPGLGDAGDRLFGTP